MLLSQYGGPQVTHYFANSRHHIVIVAWNPFWNSQGKRYPIFRFSHLIKSKSHRHFVLSAQTTNKVELSLSNQSVNRVFAFQSDGYIKIACLSHSLAGYHIWSGIDVTEFCVVLWSRLTELISEYNKLLHNIKRLFIVWGYNTADANAFKRLVFFCTCGIYWFTTLCFPV